MTRSITCGTVLAVGLLCLTSLGRADDSGVLRSKPAAEYASHQSHGSITVAAEPYEQGEKVQVAFGGAEPQVYGFLPVLLVISNESDAILKLDELRVQFVDSERQAYDPTPAAEVIRFDPRRRRRGGYPYPTVSWPWPRGSHRGPLDVWQITAREFRAPFVAPHASASGFFYFWTGDGNDVIPGATVYVTGLVDSRSKTDLMYFEVDLEPYNLQRRKEKIERARPRSRVHNRLIGYR